MDGVDGRAQNRALREKLSQNVQPTFGSDAGEAYGKGAVQPEAFIDDAFEVGKRFYD
jgi:hypothetical protein